MEPGRADGGGRFESGGVGGSPEEVEGRKKSNSLRVLCLLDCWEGGVGGGRGGGKTAPRPLRWRPLDPDPPVPTSPCREEVVEEDDD